MCISFLSIEFVARVSCSEFQLIGNGAGPDNCYVAVTPTVNCLMLNFYFYLVWFEIAGSSVTNDNSHEICSFSFCVS
jgi:hypothetical protein